MPFEKGRTKTGGRKAGAGNYATARARLDALGCDPLEGMAIIAMDPKTKAPLRGRMYAELAQYAWPKLRAIEHSGPGGTAIELNVSGTEVLERRIAGLAARIGTASSDPKPD